ncbi:MAG: hypothetical protein AB7G23_03105 [Vicinamibacterales bacterium]
MPFPLIPLLFMGAQAAGNVASNISGRRAQREQNAAQMEIERMRDKRERELQAEQIAFQESQLNPYRRELDQAGTLGRLSLMAGARYNGPQDTRTSSTYGTSRPSSGSSFSFQTDPLVSMAASAMRDHVLSGRAWDPEETGGGMNLLKLMSMASR